MRGISVFITLGIELSFPTENHLMIGGAHGRKKAPQLRGIELAVGAHSGTYIETERAHFFDRLAHVLGCQSSSEKQRDGDAFADRTTQRPIVSSARAA